MNQSTIASIGQAFEEISEAFNLDKHNQVHYHGDTAEFAKHYVKGHKGAYSSSNPTAKHEKDAEEFHNTYGVEHTRKGFAGSGTSVYTHKQTGAKFEVDRTPNGNGFHGTDHTIRKVK